jgi:hypothetical protein
MSTVTPNRRPITASSLCAFFHESVAGACRNQQVETDAATVWYLANLLTRYSRSENLFDYTADGLTLRPLALIYSGAAEAASEHERRLVLQRLGDLALFIAGLFSEMLSRRPVDVDYYIAMGGSAYRYLTEGGDGHQRATALIPVFRQLSEGFVRFVDVLAEVGEHAPGANNRDLLRTYELWTKTGSPRLARKLREQGITPVRVSGTH